MIMTDVQASSGTEHPRELDGVVTRKLTRLATQFPECTPMLERVQEVMAMENPTWDDRHAAAMYARLLGIMLKAMMVLKGERSAPEVITGFESIVDEFFQVHVEGAATSGAAG